jgi:hypothetical protein
MRITGVFTLIALLFLLSACVWADSVVVVDGAKYPFTSAGFEQAISDCLVSSACTGVDTGQMPAGTVVTAQTTLSKAMFLKVNSMLKLSGHSIRIASNNVSVECPSFAGGFQAAAGDESGSPFNLIETDGTGRHNIRIRGCTWDGNKSAITKIGSNDAYYNCMWLTQMVDSWVEDNYVENCPYFGIVVTEGLSVNDRVIGNEVVNVGQGATPISGGTATDGDAIYLEAGPTYCNIVGNLLLNNTNHGISIKGATNQTYYNTLVGNVAAGNGGYGYVALDASASYNSLIDNIAYNNVAGQWSDGGTGNIAVFSDPNATSALDALNQLILLGKNAIAPQIHIIPPSGQATDIQLTQNGVGNWDFVVPNGSTNLQFAWGGAVKSTLSNGGSISLVGSLTTGNGGTALAKYARYTATLSPSQVAANTCASQSFSSITGISSSDILIAISKPTEQAGLSVTPGHVTGTGMATINFCNNTGSPITPTASETYQLVVVQ